MTLKHKMVTLLCHLHGFCYQRSEHWVYITVNVLGDSQKAFWVELEKLSTAEKSNTFRILKQI